MGCSSSILFDNDISNVEKAIALANTNKLEQYKVENSLWCGSNDYL